MLFLQSFWQFSFYYEIFKYFRQIARDCYKPLFKKTFLSSTNLTLYFLIFSFFIFSKKWNPTFEESLFPFLSHSSLFLSKVTPTLYHVVIIPTHFLKIYVDMYPSTICIADLHVFRLHIGLPGGSVVKNPPADTGDVGLTPGSGRSPGEGNGNPL